MRGSLPWHGASPPPTGDGTHRDLHLLRPVCCLLHPKTLGEAAQYSACTGSTGLQKGTGDAAFPTILGVAPCLSFPLCDILIGTRGDVATSALRWASRVLLESPCPGEGVTDAHPAPTTWQAAKTPSTGATRPHHALHTRHTVHTRPHSPRVHPTCTQAHAQVVTTLTCTPGPHRRNPRHPACLLPPAQPQPSPHARVTSVHPPPATALPGCTCANTPAPHSRRLHTGPFPRLRLMHTWSCLHPCAPMGACPPCGMLLTATGWWGMRDICACQTSYSPELSPSAQPPFLQLLQTTLTPQHLLEAAAPSTCTYALPADPHTA